MNVISKRIDASSFHALMARFSEIYFATFPANERRLVARPGGMGVQDDGLLTGPSFEELLERERFILKGFFVEQALVGFWIAIDLDGGPMLGDYLAMDPMRKDLVGLGQTIFSDFLAEVKKNGKDAVAEVETLQNAPDSNEPGISLEEKKMRESTLRTRSQRLLMHKRKGYYFMDELKYELTSGVQMSIGIWPNPSRKIIEVNGKKLPYFESGELERIIRQVRSTYD